MAYRLGGGRSIHLSYEGESGVPAQRDIRMVEGTCDARPGEAAQKVHATGEPTVNSRSDTRPAI